MKKFTFLLSLFLTVLGAGMASAQDLKVSPAPTGNAYAEGTTWYTIKINIDAGGYLSVDGGYLDGMSLKGNNTTKPTDLKGYWCVTGDAETGYQLRNAAMPASMVLGVTGSQDGARCAMYYAGNTVDGATTNFDYVESGSGTGYAFKLQGSEHNYLNYRGVYLALWDNASAQSGPRSALVFEEVQDVAPAVELLGYFYKVTNSSTEYTWKQYCTAYAAEGTSISTAPTLNALYTNVQLSAGDNTVTAENNEVAVTCQSSGTPFMLSTADNKVWYTVQFRGKNAGNYMVRSTDSNILSGAGDNHNSPFTADNVASYTAFGNGLWAFEESNGGVKVYNKVAGKYITTSTTTNGTASLTEEGMVFSLMTNSHNNGAGFSLKVPGVDNGYLGDHGGGAAGSLGTWANNSAQNDGGSSFEVTAVDGNEMLMAIAKAAFVKSYAEETYVGGYGPDAATEAATYVENLTTVAQFDEAVTAFKPTSFKAVDASKFYRIIYKRGGVMANKYDTSSGNTVGETSDAYADAKGNVTTEENRYVITKEGLTDLSTFWQFEAAETDGQYYLKNVNSGLVAGTTNGRANLRLLGPGVLREWAGLYSIESCGTADSREHALRDHKIDGEEYLNCYYNPNAGASTNNNRQLTHYQDVQDPGNILYIVEVTDIPVTISAAGYATLNLPFEVSIPAGVTASYVTGVTGDNGDELVMVDLNGVIPANTPVILQSETAATYNFAINTTATATAVSGNKLTGTTMERHGLAEAGDYYGLGNLGGVVAFYRATSDEVPANKAILFKDDIVTTEGIQALRFGGEVTGIGGVTTTTDKAKDNIYYDLKGRRVVYPSKGIYINGNGQKVFIR